MEGYLVMNAISKGALPLDQSRRQPHLAPTHTNRADLSACRGREASPSTATAHPGSLLRQLSGHMVSILCSTLI